MYSTRLPQCFVFAEYEAYFFRFLQIIFMVTTLFEQLLYAEVNLPGFCMHRVDKRSTCEKQSCECELFFLTSQVEVKPAVAAVIRCDVSEMGS